MAQQECSPPLLKFYSTEAPFEAKSPVPEMTAKRAISFTDRDNKVKNEKDLIEEDLKALRPENCEIIVEKCKNSPFYMEKLKGKLKKIEKEGPFCKRGLSADIKTKDGLVSIKQLRDRERKESAPAYKKMVEVLCKLSL
jgi:hypothetical protein